MKRKANPGITQQEISAALARFLQQGGMIKKLPAQNFRTSGTIGGEKYQAYESLSDLPAVTGSNERVA